MSELGQVIDSHAPWMDFAACGNAIDPEIFFQDHERDLVRLAQAKAVCATCPVRAECLQYALDEEIWHGMWGGLTERERFACRRRRRAAGWAR